jgi:hypothetical protein
VKVSYERLINLGNYNNERIALEDDVQPDETPEAAYQRLRALVYAMAGLADPKAAKASPLAERERRDAAGIEF